LIQKTGCRVIFGYEERLADAGGFKTHFVEPDAGVYSDDLDVHLAAMNRTLESCVRQNLEQYQWSYKRFKRQADGRKIYAACP
jgi:KDO2-lipid IV(A) lauroyltransferase